MEGIEKLGQQIEKLTREATEHQLPKEVTIKGEPSHITWLYNFKTGALELHEADAHPRAYVAGGIRAVGQLINEFATRLVGERTRVILACVQNGSVVAVLDEEGDRRERVRADFKRSPGFVAVAGLATRAPMSQREFIDFLRTECAGEYTPSHVLSTIRSIKFTSNSSGNSTIQTGKASMGKSIEAEISGIDGTAMDDLETLHIKVPVYSDLLDEQGKPVECSIECHLDIDLTEQVFRLRPKAGEIERVLLETDTRIMDDLDFRTMPPPPPAPDDDSTSAPRRGRVLIVRGIPN